MDYTAPFIKTIAVGTTSVRLSEVSLPCKGVLVKAYSTNTGICYVGNEKEILAATGSVFELNAQEAIYVVCKDINKLWFISDTASQKVCVKVDRKD